ncbi:MAG TPA: GNAT family N-acetyltransferase [Candidatus Binataceae bacterium]|nr:GNAT family N-acetyltransferase [Candidatus Binataceae bacterium]
MIDTTYVGTLEWVKKLAAVYIEGYEKFLRAAANYPRLKLTPSHNRIAGRRAAKRRSRLSIDQLNRYASAQTLRDGGLVDVRAVRAEDKERLLDHFNRLSAASLYYRFLGRRGALTDDELDRFTRIDNQHAALIVTLSGDHDSIIGFIQYVRVQDSARAQLACSVSDEHQGRGIGTMMFDLLGRVALANGIAEFEGDALQDNQRVLAIAAKNGRRVEKSTETGIVRICISLRKPRSSRPRTQSSRRARSSASSRPRQRVGSGWLM